MKRILFILIYIWSVCHIGYGQTLPDPIFQEEFKYRVKQLDEFMSRFNGEESIGMDIPDSLKTDLNILYLFNSDLFATNRDSMMQQTNQFIQTIKENNVSLHFDDKEWFAEVLCYCTYKDKEEQITLYLKPEKIEEYMFRWVIIGAKGKPLKLTPQKKNRGLDILPNNNEVAFMALSKIDQLGHANILNYAQQNYVPDQLTAFYALIYSGALKIMTTDKITYHFLKVPDYVFKVNRFIRKGNNTGWLISSLIQLPEQEKKMYYQQCLTE